VPSKQPAGPHAKEQDDDGESHHRLELDGNVTAENEFLSAFPDRAPSKSRVPSLFFAEWHRFAPIFPTADASPTFGMRRENSNVK
jgi:hypothetical protein